MEEAKESVRSDIAIMKTAAEKTDHEVAKAEEDKRKQVGHFEFVNFCLRFDPTEVTFSCLHSWGFIPDPS